METQTTQLTAEETYGQLETHLKAAYTADLKFESGIKSASTQARNILQEIIKLCKDRRMQITLNKNARAAVTAV